jgi:hypothetical protein
MPGIPQSKTNIGTSIAADALLFIKIGRLTANPFVVSIKPDLKTWPFFKGSIFCRFSSSLVNNVN